MLLATSAAHTIFDNVAFDVIASLIVGALAITGKFAPRGFRTWRDERALMRGRRGAPGLKAVKPLGDRLDAAEATMQDHTVVLSEHTVILEEQSAQLKFIVGELSPNSGHSIKDTVTRLANELAAIQEQK